MRHVSELQVPWFGRPVLLGRGKLPRARGMAAYIRDCYRAFCQPKFECGCCELLVFRFCGVRHAEPSRVQFLPQSWPRWPDFLLLLASMATVQADDIHVSLLFVGDLNGHHQEWLGSSTTNRHEVPAFDIATVSGWDQLVVGRTHARGGTLDLLMTDVPDLVWVAVVAPISNSDHSLLSAVISMAQAVKNMCVRRKVFPKHQVNWNTVCGAIQDLPWCNIWPRDNPVGVLKEHLSLLVGRYVPYKVIRVRNKD